MTSVPIRVLMINRQLNVAIKLKKALDKSGNFQMTTFTSPSAAFDYLAENPQDIVVLDFTLPRLSGIDMVLRTRAIQPDVAIVASPNQPEVQSVVRDLDLDGISDMPTTARRLAPILQTAYSQMRDALPETAEAPAYGAESDTLTIDAPESESIEPSPTIEESDSSVAPQFSSLDSVLVHVGGFDEEVGTETLDVDMSDMEGEEISPKKPRSPRSIEFVIKGDYDELRDRVQGPPLVHPLADDADNAVGIFQKIASEEPPVPTFEESGTVGDLMIGVGDTNLREVVKILQDSQNRQPKGSEKEAKFTDDQLPFYEGNIDEMGDNTARMVLQSALSESANMDYSLDDLVSNIENQVPEEKRAVRADLATPELLLPHVDEPDFLPEDSVEIARVTRPAPASLPEQPEADDAVMDFDEATDPKVVETMAQTPPPPSSLPEMPDQDVLLEEALADSDSDHIDAVSDEASPVDEIELPIADDEVEAVIDDSLPPLDDDRPETGPIATEEEAEYETGFNTPQPVESIVEDDPQIDAEKLDAVAEVTDDDNPLPDAVYDEPDTSTDVDDSEYIDEVMDDPELARLALSLTQGSLELSAEATLLTRENRVIAMAGDLLREDIDDISHEIGHDWQAYENDTRIRFITLKATGQEFLIYTRRTEDDYSLSMIFAKNMRLSAIRKQSDQLIDALNSVPVVAPVEPEVIEDAPDVQELTEQLEAIEEEITSHMQAVGQTPTDLVPQVDAGPLTTYTFVWMVNDPEFVLNNEVAQAVVAGLDFQLAREGWRVDLLQVHEDYLYIMAGIPGESIAQELINDLKQRAAEMAHGSDDRITPETLWSDSYLAFVPGRELHVEEIQRYINFARAR